MEIIGNRSRILRIAKPLTSNFLTKLIYRSPDPLSPQCQMQSYIRVRFGKVFFNIVQEQINICLFTRFSKHSSRLTYALVKNVGHFNGHLLATRRNLKRKKYSNNFLIIFLTNYLLGFHIVNWR